MVGDSMKFYTKIMLAGLVLGFFLWGLSTKAEADPEGKTSDVQQQGTPQPNNKYFTDKTVTLDNGVGLQEYIINGPPHPPAGYEIERASSALPHPNRAMSINSLTVPAYNWVYGCSAVSAAMIAGYYDRTGYPNIYTGPTNGGVMTLDSSPWPDWTDGANEVYPQNPLIASHLGLDGRVTRGSLDDYWVLYGSAEIDPFITNGWVQHAWGDAIGDYMKTSQSTYNNTDGSTHFYNYTSSSASLTCSAMETASDSGRKISDLDGTYGRKLFYQSKGYTVTDCYNQNTDNNGGGFKFANFKAEIDAGRPVLLNLAGHSIVGVGYDSSSTTVYIHDTWDYETHSMIWGGSYAGMSLLSVSIVDIATNQPPTAFTKRSPATGATAQSTNPTLSWGSASGTTDYQYCYDTTNDNACSSWQSAGTSTYVNLSGLHPNTTYYWQVQAWNGSLGPTYADGSSTAFSSFTTQAAPGVFTKSTPLNADNDQPTNVTLSWQSTSPVTSYDYCYERRIIFVLPGIMPVWIPALRSMG
jgi:hypothetical protein